MIKKLGITVLLASTLLLAACGESGVSLSGKTSTKVDSSLSSTSVTEEEALQALADGLSIMEYDTIGLTAGIDGTFDLEFTNVATQTEINQEEMTVTQAVTKYDIAVEAHNFLAQAKLGDLVLDQEGNIPLQDAYIEGTMTGDLGIDVRTDTTILVNGVAIEGGGGTTTFVIPVTTFNEAVHIKDEYVYLDISDEAITALGGVNDGTLSNKMLLPCPPGTMDLSFLGEIKAQAPALLEEFIQNEGTLGATCTKNSENIYNMHFVFSGEMMMEMVVAYIMSVYGVVQSPTTTSGMPTMEDSIRELLKDLEFGELIADLSYSEAGDYFALDLQNLVVTGEIDLQTGTDPLTIDADLDLSLIYEPGVEVDTNWTPEGDYTSPAM